MEFQKILVPIGGTEVDYEAMQLACRLAKQNKSKIYSVYVITIKRSLPIEAEIEYEIEAAEKLLDQIEKVAEDQDYEADTDVLQSRDAGPAIVDEAVEKGIDLIIMGVKYKRRFGQFTLGSIARYVIKNAPCAVMLYQQYSP